MNYLSLLSDPLLEIIAKYDECQNFIILNYCSTLSSEKILYWHVEKHVNGCHPIDCYYYISAHYFVLDYKSSMDSGKTKVCKLGGIRNIFSTCVFYYTCCDCMEPVIKFIKYFSDYIYKRKINVNCNCKN